jgi:replicative DNA helicase
MNSNIELEQQLLGTILRHPDALKHLDGLSTDSFSDPLNRIIYAEILSQVADNNKISIATLGLKAGNNKYLSSLVTMDALHDIKGAGDVLGELAARRMVDSIAREVVGAMERGASSAEGIHLLAPLTTGEALESQSRSMHDSGRVTEDIMADLLSDVKPFSTGIRSLDEAMGGGLYPRKAYGIAARKKVGKTIMLGTLSHNLNMAGVKHLFICGEMGEREIQQRVLCRALDMYPSAFRSGYAEKPMVMQKIAAWAKSAPKNTIYLDSPAITFEKLKHAIVTAHMRHGIKGFILDYWQLVAGKDGRSSEAYHLGEVAQWIAEIGRKLDIFSITAAQINQDGNTRGGEGMRLAFDQVYHLQPIGKDGGDITMPSRWLEMMDTRYTPWMNIGEEGYAGLTLNEKGLFFEEV